MVGLLTSVAIRNASSVIGAIVKYRKLQAGAGIRALSINGQAGSFSSMSDEEAPPVIHVWSDELHQVPQYLCSKTGEGLAECVSADDGRPNFPKFSVSVLRRELESRSCLYGRPLLAAHSLSSTQVVFFSLSLS